jgi:HEAT repeat protein
LITFPGGPVTWDAFGPDAARLRNVVHGVLAGREGLLDPILIGRATRFRATFGGFPHHVHRRDARRRILGPFVLGRRRRMKGRLPTGPIAVATLCLLMGGCGSERHRAEALASVAASGTEPDETRLSCVQQLAALGPRATSATHTLSRVLADRRQEANLRAAVANALTKIGDPAGLGQVVEHADAVDIRVDAVLQLGGKGGEGRPELERLGRHESAEVRALATAGLRQQGKPAVAELAALLSDREVRVRMAAALCLADMGREATGALEALKGRGSGASPPLSVDESVLRKLAVNTIEGAGDTSVRRQAGAESVCVSAVRQAVQGGYSFAGGPGTGRF